MTSQDESKPPFPPFTEETARIKVKTAQDAWNTRNPTKWEREQGYRLRKELFAFTDNKIAVQFWYEWHDESGQWWRTYGLEDWTFADNGLMRKRQMSANDVKIEDSQRWFVDGVDVNTVSIGEQHW
ncbi:hypothetical protein Cob_v008886 [Colletotrichum orbiculare MAFF 240422]|uniref:Duf1348 domain containing protein n=1 Tax=Colletotrichum orbiculare (strain 104-T / ATCC 96160 / CBS 514.97 / LARS 414 / MAFF 240422) TaxID=1213857 RepID=A0A484FIB3_COLOR|nr:hypothetical protein Cob_v008886 [Colletotrichum orbiculare MAFF 240422]